MRHYYDAHLYFANWARTGSWSGFRARFLRPRLPSSTASTRRSACQPPAIKLGEVAFGELGEGAFEV